MWQKESFLVKALVVSVCVQPAKSIEDVRYISIEFYQPTGIVWTGLTWTIYLWAPYNHQTVTLTFLGSVQLQETYANRGEE